MCKINAPHATEMQPKWLECVKAKCSPPPWTGKLLVRVNGTSRVDVNWGWKSHSEIMSRSQLAKLPGTSGLEI